MPSGFLSDRCKSLLPEKPFPLHTLRSWYSLLPEYPDLHSLPESWQVLRKPGHSQKKVPGFLQGSDWNCLTAAASAQFLPGYWTDFSESAAVLPAPAWSLPSWCLTGWSIYPVHPESGLHLLTWQSGWCLRSLRLCLPGCFRSVPVWLPLPVLLLRHWRT